MTERKTMKLKKWQSAFRGGVRDEISLVCTPEEYEMLREFLEHEGVNLTASIWSPDECTVYVRNPWREVVFGWGTEPMKKLGAEFFDRNKRQ